MSYLLDTNVVCELRKRHLFVSVLTVGEIRLGIERLRRKDSTQADVLEQWLDGLRAPTAITSSRSTRG